MFFFLTFDLSIRCQCLSILKFKSRPYCAALLWQGVFVVWVVPLAPTLTINDTLHDLLQPHHVDELRVGSRGQEVQQRRWRFRWRYLQQGLLQLLAEGQFSGCLAAGLVVQRSHAGGTGKGGGADSTYPDASHTSCSCCLHVCQVHVDSRGRA